MHPSSTFERFTWHVAPLSTALRISRKSRRGAADNSIIFVHGLGGDNLKTWSDKESGKQWISYPEFLQTWESDVRVLTLGYNTTNVMLNVNPVRIAIHSKDLLEKLLIKRLGAEESGHLPIF